MDRGIPTEEVLAEMRASDPPVLYLVGTPKGRLSKLEAQLSELPWEQVREGVEVKLLPREGELYVFAKSRDRMHKERAMRRRRLKELLARLRELAGMKLKRDALLIKIGAAKAQAGRVFSLVDIQLPKARQPVNAQTFTFALNRSKLREVCRREGRYLLRSHLVTECETEKLWEFYMQLTRIEDAFKNLKGDLAIRPIHHQREDRIEAHIFIAFLAYCLQVTLQRRLRDLAPGLTARRARQVRRRADDRRASADDRRTHRDHAAIHPAGERTQTLAAQLENRTSRPATAQNHCQRKSPPIARCSADLLYRCAENQQLTTHSSSNPRSRVRLGSARVTAYSPSRSPNTALPSRVPHSATFCCICNKRLQQTWFLCVTHFRELAMRTRPGARGHESR